MCGIPKVSGLIFEMVNSLEMYIIYCTTILAMITHRLRLTGTYMTASESDVNFESAEMPAYCSKNSDILVSSLCSSVLASLPCLDELNIGRFSGS
jgi:hypothetical protein